ncbi:C25 family cysteine peptidase [Dyadobacter sp. 32]|uniref:putative type IX secretion system sortase PorU2 n=1 Tax=Dyadobacter sp. 32 TaxID=538966 RepID=UPI0011ED66BD
MKCKFFSCFFIIFYCLILSTPGFAQWSGKYGNEWISYESKYVKLNVTEAGLYKVALSSLPEGFSKDPLTLQMWRRGKEVSIVHVDNKELWFYAELNDGASDSLLFRPASARMNPYQSFFSDQGVYFLTNGKNPKRSVQVDKIPLTGQPETYHLQTDVVSLREQFAFATLNNTPAFLNNSYYENFNGWTGPVVYGDSAVGRTATNVTYTRNFSLPEYQFGTGKTPILNVMLNGLHYGRHEVQIAAGKTSSDLAPLATINFTGIGGLKREGIAIREDQLSAENGGVITWKSKTKELYDWFSVAYYSLTYPQKVKMTNNKSRYFHFQATSEKVSRIKIETINNGNLVILDVSNPYEPKLLQGSQSGNNWEVMVPRTEKGVLRILGEHTEQIKSITQDKISSVDFAPVFAKSSLGGEVGAISPTNYDYLIVTSDTLQQAAIEYAKYRNSTVGGSFNTIVYEVRNLYNQFNYGEPSPVALKRFVEYMLKDGIRENHNLLLVGYGVSTPDPAGNRLRKDLPHDVPTIGDPGSDILLVSGLHGLGQDVPAIPVGRISAFNEQYVLNYLDKVKEFESDKANKQGQKKILHLNGGKTSEEINQLGSILRNLSPLVENGDFGGEVKAFVKQTTIETEKVDISKDVNEGVGMISYFGHGSPLVTDLDMGKVSDASRNFSNTGKYPLMYFNGCGVGNIYQSRLTIVLSTDWLVSPKVGAIAIIANSFHSYVSPSTKQLKILYDELFVKNTANSMTIGQILLNVSRRSLASSPDNYDIANIHQSNLQGDPAIRLFSFASPDYALDSDKPVIILGESATTNIGASTKLRTGIILSNNGKYVKGQNVPVKFTYTLKNGLKNIRTENFMSFPSKDTILYELPVDSKSIARIEVSIDPLNTIPELSKTNNVADLSIDWEVANKLVVYPDVVTKDVIAPVFVVTINDRNVKNEEVVLPNPVINVQLSDDRSLDLNPTLFDLFIRPCWGEGCEFKKIEIDASSLKFISSREVLLSLILKDARAGNYELLVNGKDGSGNSSSNSYTLRFAISEATDTPFDLVVSPNPASEFLRFDLEAVSDVIESVRYSIYNLSGRVVSSSDFKIKYSGKQSWYWLRNGNPAGMYFYEVEVTTKDKGPTLIRGKVILQ